MKKGIILLLLGLGLMSCEKDITPPPVNKPITYSKKEVIEYLHYWITHSNQVQGGMYFLGDFSWNPNGFASPGAGHSERSLVITADTTSSTYTFDLDFLVKPVAYVKQQPFVYYKSWISGDVNTFGIVMKWEVDEGDYIRKTEVRLFAPNNDKTQRPKCVLNQKLIQKNDGTWLGDKILKYLTFESY